MTVKPHRVSLTPFEMFLAAYIGVQRQIRSLLSGRRNQHGFKGDPWGVHIEGTGAEMAVAKALRIYYEPRVDVFNDHADVADNIDVRRRSHEEWDLLIRRRDSNERDHVHVTGRMPNYAIWGWLSGPEVRELKNHPELQKTFDDRPPAWFVDRNQLHPIEELRPFYS